MNERAVTLSVRKENREDWKSEKDFSPGKRTPSDNIDAKQNDVLFSVGANSKLSWCLGIFCEDDLYEKKYIDDLDRNQNTVNTANYM